jgi:hypothetical protein
MNRMVEVKDVIEEDCSKEALKYIARKESYDSVEELVENAVASTYMEAKKLTSFQKFLKNKK